jgi:hypothetical protein
MEWITGESKDPFKGSYKYTQIEIHTEPLLKEIFSKKDEDDTSFFKSPPLLIIKRFKNKRPEISIVNYTNWTPSFGGTGGLSHDRGIIYIAINDNIHSFRITFGEDDIIEDGTTRLLVYDKDSILKFFSDLEKGGRISCKSEECNYRFDTVLPNEGSNIEYVIEDYFETINGAKESYFRDGEPTMQETNVKHLKQNPSNRY